MPSAGIAIASITLICCTLIPAFSILPSKILFKKIAPKP